MVDFFYHSPSLKPGLLYFPQWPDYEDYSESVRSDLLR